MQSLRYVLLALLATLQFIAVSSTAMAKDNLSPDAKTLKALADAGSDLKKPHVIDHWLYFSSESDARAAATDLSAAGFSVESVAASADSNEWRVLAQKTIVPTLEEVEKTSSYLESLARRHHGEYDGWETQIEE